MIQSYEFHGGKESIELHINRHLKSDVNSELVRGYRNMNDEWARDLHQQWMN